MIPCSDGCDQISAVAGGSRKEAFSVWQLILIYIKSWFTKGKIISYIILFNYEGSAVVTMNDARNEVFTENSQ